MAMLVANRSRTPLTSTTSISATDSLDHRTVGAGDSITHRHDRNAVLLREHAESRRFFAHTRRLQHFAALSGVVALNVSAEISSRENRRRVVIFRSRRD
ncbi:MAG: hypothetical protein WKG01_35170 [Kofleriaceae bacterium]